MKNRGVWRRATGPLRSNYTPSGVPSFPGRPLYFQHSRISPATPVGTIAKLIRCPGVSSDSALGARFRWHRLQSVGFPHHRRIEPILAKPHRLKSVLLNQSPADGSCGAAAFLACSACSGETSRDCSTSARMPRAAAFAADSVVMHGTL